MDKKKLYFFATLLAMIFIIIGILISMNSKNDTNTISESIASERPSEFEEEVEEHTEYIQDANEDPLLSITSEEGELTVDKINFHFETLKGASYEHTAATLIDSSENFLLYHNYNDVLSFYDGVNNEKKVLDEHFNQAIITPDENYIIYSKNAFNKEIFYYLDLNTLQTKEFYTYAHDLRMKVIDLEYKNGLLYFLIEETESGKTSVHFSAIPSYIDSFTAKQREDVITIDTKELYYTKEKIYAFNRKTNTIDELKPLNQPTPLMSIASEQVKEIRSVDFYNENKWAVAFLNEENEYIILTPTDKITSYTGLMSAHWFDDNHLIVNDNLSLYLYNMESKENHVLKTGISYVFPTIDKATIQTNEGAILIMKKN